MLVSLLCRVILR